MSLHSIAAGKMTYRNVTPVEIKGKYPLTKLSLISMLLSFVSGGATTSKFLTIVATTIFIIACAKFCPPHTREPVPKGII